jgi:phosphoenolpyruvate carboxylase
MLRTAKLSVDDEIENALSYYRATFLAQIPILYREVEDAFPGTRSRRSFAWATGSAATATATRSSTPAHCAPRSRSRPRRRCATT